MTVLCFMGNNAARGRLSKAVSSHCYFRASDHPPARFGSSISSGWMKLKCWRDTSFRPVHGPLRRKSGPCTRPKYNSLSPLSRCLQVCMMSCFRPFTLNPPPVVNILLYYLIRLFQRLMDVMKIKTCASKDSYQQSKNATHRTSLVFFKMFGE